MLSLFVGAGVSVGAGLPTWGTLLEAIAKEASLSKEDTSRLWALPFLDQVEGKKRKKKLLSPQFLFCRLDCWRRGWAGKLFSFLLLFLLFTLSFFVSHQSDAASPDNCVLGAERRLLADARHAGMKTPHQTEYVCDLFLFGRALFRQTAWSPPTTTRSLKRLVR